MNFGDVPTWIAAIGTAGTLVAALSQISNERQRHLAADEQLRIAKHLEQCADSRLVLDFNFAYQPSSPYDPRWPCPLTPHHRRTGSPWR